MVFYDHYLQGRRGETPIKSSTYIKINAILMMIVFFRGQNVFLGGSSHFTFFGLHSWILDKFYRLININLQEKKFFHGWIKN